jgi:hypothetical protein
MNRKFFIILAFVILGPGMVGEVWSESASGLFSVTEIAAYPDDLSETRALSCACYSMLWSDGRWNYIYVWPGDGKGFQANGEDEAFRQCRRARPDIESRYLTVRCR